MKNLFTTICLTLAVLLGSAGYETNGQSYVTKTYANGDQYVGEIWNGKPHGQGTYTHANGNKYVGEFRDNKRNGQGTFTFASGRKYAGEWKADKRHGRGTVTFANGNNYVGEYRDDTKNGQGTITWADGEKYVGEWKDGRRTGQGTYTSPDGRIEEGIWKRGQFQYAQKVTPPQKYNPTERHSSFKQKCTEIGFTPKTEKFGDCVLRLMEMQSNNGPKTVIQNNSGNGAAVRALLEEQKKQRQLDGSLELMKRSLEMLNPPTPKLTCKYNSFTRTTVCN
jgi:hypothetical protein